MHRPFSSPSARALALGLSLALAGCSDPVIVDDYHWYELTYDDVGAIWATDVDGAAPVLVANSAATMLDASWSPDGTRAVFTRHCEADPECPARLMVLDARSGEEHPLVGGEDAAAVAGAWSPRGDLIAYRSVSDESADGHTLSTLRLVRPDETDDRPVGAAMPYWGDPSWSPDGRRIAITRMSDEGPEIVVIDVERGSALPVAEGASPSWSPDGTRLVFTDIQELATIRLDGTDRRVIAPVGYDAAWSPDGLWIAYHVPTSFGKVFVVRPDGDDPRNVTESADRAFRPAWRRR